MSWLSTWFTGHLWKAIKSAILTALTAAIVSKTHDPKYAAIVPLITTFSGWLRKKYPGTFDWLPV